MSNSMEMLKLTLIMVAISLAGRGEGVSISREAAADEGLPFSLEDCPDEDRVTYTAAVLEYEPVSDWATAASGVDILRRNIESIYQFIKVAKENGADIFVSPEYGTTSLDMYKNDSVHFQSITQRIPDPEQGVVPCTLSQQLQNFDAIKNLSCIAREQEIYLVIDVAEQAPCDEAVAPCQADGLSFFNAQVVFDRTGQVIARYRKQNLYLEDQFVPGPPDDSTAIFTTDFGVKFSLQVCFDITFQHPGYWNVLNEGVRDVAMSTAWVDESPFLLAISVQNGWSRALGTNLIVSGYHWPEHTKLGSGVYRAHSDLSFNYTYDPNSGNVVVVHPVDTCRSAPATATPERVLSEPRAIALPAAGAPREDRHRIVLHEDLSVYLRTVLPLTQQGETNTVTQCHDDGLCCRLEYELSSSNLTYQLLTYSGVVLKGGVYQIYEQVCAVVWCASEDWRTCGRIELFSPPEDTFGPFTIEGSYSCETVFPIGLTRDWNLIPNTDYVMSANDSTYSLTSLGTFNTLSVGLFGRWYSRDP